ncbi:MAG: molybdenum cofactor biosynthesis protein [Desulfuromonas sp.]|nr:MAG: molybdenum cofactor biosynthesis protein [Desulfuromonas sp.]
MRIAVLTISDRGYRGEREDAGGPLLTAWLGEQGYAVAETGLVPDETAQISAQLAAWADSGAYDLVLTTGGTGVSPRDVTPEATLEILDRQLPGFAELMRMRSLEKTPMAIISRALAGIRGTCLIINLPGSPKAAIENLAAVWPAVPHASEKIRGDASDCADRFTRS